MSATETAEATVERWSQALARRARVDLGGSLASILALVNATDVISFAGGFPDPSVLPGPILADILAALLAAGDSSPLQYSPVGGLPGPRAFVRERLGRMEGREPQEAEFIITSGGIEALELVAKSFLDPGDTAVLEAPTYLGAIMAVRGYEADAVGVPVDDQGLDVDELRSMLADGCRPKFVYTIPDYQNPTGVSLSAERRSEVVDLARRYGFLIVEDVAYRELGFDDHRLPSVWSIGPDVTLQAGTFSKTFFPGVRLGWAAGPAEVVSKLADAKQNTDQCAGALGQRLLEEYGRRGELDAGIVRSRSLYASRCRALLGALSEWMPEGVRWTEPAGGFFCWLTLPNGADTVVLAMEAARRGVAFVPGQSFFPGPARPANHLRLAFSKVPEEQIREGVRRLGDLIAETASRP